VLAVPEMEVVAVRHGELVLVSFARGGAALFEVAEAMEGGGAVGKVGGVGGGSGGGNAEVGSWREMGTVWECEGDLDDAMEADWMGGA